MANKRQQERDRLRKARQETEKREASAQRRRLLIGYGIAAVLGIAVIGGVVVLITGGGGSESGGGKAHINIASGITNGVPTDDRTGPAPPPVANDDLQSAAKAANCVVMLDLTDEGHTHVKEGTKVDYKTNPPSSGNHVEPAHIQADGAYSETPESIEYVHSLEHGRMEIQYSSKLSDSDQKDLKGLYDSLYGGTLLFPNDTMPYQVAAVTWTNILGCKTYEGAKTLDAIRAFGKETWNRFGAPAELDSFPINGPTPAG